MGSAPRRRLVAGTLAGGAVLGSIGVSAAALSGHHPPHVVAAGKASATRAPLDTTTTVIVTTTTAAPTTSTTRPVPAPTTTSPPATVPPTMQAPPTTVALTASLQISPSPADFPSLPPPYWPMPIVHVTVTNTGGVTVDSVVVHPVGVYSVPSSTCSTLGPGQSCGADVQFCPTSPGSYVNTLTVTGRNVVTAAAFQASITLDGTAI